MSGKCPLQVSASVRVQGLVSGNCPHTLPRFGMYVLVDFKPPVIKFLFAFGFLLRKTNKTDTKMTLGGLKPVFSQNHVFFGSETVI